MVKEMFNVNRYICLKYYYTCVINQVDDVPTCKCMISLYWRYESDDILHAPKCKILLF